MRRGAQYKVLSTIFNILRQVSLIQCTCVGHRFFTRERRLRPRDRPRSSQRPRHYRCCTCTCAARHARKDRAAKHPERMRQSRTRAAARHNRARPAAARQPPKSRNRSSDSSMIIQQAPATTAATTATITNVPKSCPRCCQPPSSCSHHLQPSSQTLPSSPDEWMSPSAAVTGRVRDQRDAYQRRSQGGWRPADIVRATPGRPCRLDEKTAQIY